MPSFVIYQSQSRGLGYITFTKRNNQLSWSIEVGRSLGCYVLEFRRKIFESFDSSGVEMKDETLALLDAMFLAWQNDFSEMKKSKLSEDEKMAIYAFAVQKDSSFGDIALCCETKQGVIDQKIYPALYHVISTFIVLTS